MAILLSNKVLQQEQILLLNDTRISMVLPTRTNTKPRRRSVLRVVFVVLALVSWFWIEFLLTDPENERELSPQHLQRLIDDLRGDDHRLMRWDAKRETRRKQDLRCTDDLARAMNVLRSSYTDEHRVLACEFLTFCITDNPLQRFGLSEHPHIHKDILRLAESKNATLSSKASHLIYISSFANPKNHQEFIHLGGVGILGSIVKSDSSDPIQVMWAAAALQNLAASYCETEDGRCQWKWNKASYKSPELQIKPSSLPLVSDGNPARIEISMDKGLMQKLMEYTCRGPVRGNESPSNVFPGGTARAGRDEESPNIVPWAAAGVLKNVALSSSRELLFRLEPAATCLCRMAHSQDWLEENKGASVIQYTRRRDPCWFGETGEDYENPDAELCVDRYFVDSEGHDCSSYEKSGETECATWDITGTFTAKDACCPCGGGSRESRKGVV